MQRAALAFVLAVTGWACGSQIEPPMPTGARGPAAAGATLPPDVADQAAEAERLIAESAPSPSASVPTPQAGRTDTAPDDVYPDLAPGEKTKLWGEMDLDITLEPSVCATHGTVMRAVITTVPDALIGAAVRYSDGQPHEDWSWGRAPTGEFVWTWTIKPTVPDGVSKAMVTAGKSGESGAAVMAVFEVAAAC